MRSSRALLDRNTRSGSGNFMTEQSHCYAWKCFQGALADCRNASMACGSMMLSPTFCASVSSTCLGVSEQHLYDAFMRKVQASIVLPAAILISAATWATDEDGLQSLLLYPNSTVEVTRSDRCAVIENISDALVFVPLDREAWLNFVVSDYSFVRVMECARS